MTEPTIRPFAKTDSGAIVNLIAEYRAEDPGRSVDRSVIAATLRDFASSAQNHIFVAEIAGEVAGYVAVHWVPFPMIQGWEAYISDLIVSQSVRGSGIGRRLLETAESEARKRGCARLMLNNSKTTQSFVRGFYPKHGFRERDGFANFVKTLR
jgi:ribosomal protein S18 acetylase RimI-like enzyme